MSQITNDMKMNIDFYEYENELLTVVIVLALISFTLVMVLNYYNFLNFWGDVGKESNFVIAIFIYASDSSHYTLSKYDMVYRCLSHSSGDISVSNVPKDANSAEMSENTSASNSNI